jgi:hypothetical protein
MRSIILVALMCVFLNVRMILDKPVTCLRNFWSSQGNIQMNGDILAWQMMNLPINTASYPKTAANFTFLHLTGLYSVDKERDI